MDNVHEKSREYLTGKAINKLIKGIELYKITLHKIEENSMFRAQKVKITILDDLGEEQNLTVFLRSIYVCSH